MTGWTFDQIDALPATRGSELLGYWDEHPPVHEMVAAYLGIRSKPSKPRHTTLDEVRAAMREMMN